MSKRGAKSARRSASGFSWHPGSDRKHNPIPAPLLKISGLIKFSDASQDLVNESAVIALMPLDYGANDSGQNPQHISMMKLLRSTNTNKLCLLTSTSIRGDYIRTEQSVFCANNM